MEWLGGLDVFVANVSTLALAEDRELAWRRFYEGTFQGSDFPTGVPTQVRIEIHDLAETIKPGHRLAMEVSHGETHTEWTGQPYASEITVRTDGEKLASHVVLPIADGTLDGDAPTLDYPPRPFVPTDDCEQRPGTQRSDTGCGVGHG